MTKISERIEKVKGNINVDNIYTDERLGELLNTVVKVYFAQLDSYNSIISDMNKVKSTRLLSAGMTGYNPKVSYMFNSPTEIREGSLYIDIDRDIHSVVSLEGNKEKEVEYMLTTGVIASSMEHKVFEQLTDTPSVSAIKILEESNKREIPIYNITKDNITEILVKLEVSESVKRDVTNAVREGKTVSIPERSIDYGEWIGTGYIVLDTETGSAGYMISGGLAGGSTSATEMFERLVEYLEGAQDSFIENCTWLVETLIGKSSLKRMTISLVDFTLGLSVGMIEPMTVGISTEIAEQIANIQDKSSYLLGKICGNVITSMNFSGIAAGSGLGAVVALPTGGGTLILGGAAVVSGAVVISANTWFIVNSLMFAETLGSGNGGSSGDDGSSSGDSSGDISKIDIDTVINSAIAPKKGGETIVGHALQKHAGRNPDIWGKIKGGAEEINQTALNHLQEIIDGPGNFTKVTNERGISFHEKWLQDGRGARLNMDGTFKGFID